MKCSHFLHGPIAQPVEHLTFNQGVAGSNPAGLTIQKLLILEVLSLLDSPNKIFKNLHMLVVLGMKMYARIVYQGRTGLLAKATSTSKKYYNKLAT